MGTPAAHVTSIGLHLFHTRARIIMKSAIYSLGIVLAAAIAPAWAQGALPTDPQIAAIVVTANQVDIDAGKLAERKAHAAQVKAFAKRMVTDHTGVNQAAISLAGKLHLTPESNPTSESLKQGGEANIAALEKLHGGAFDKAYIDHEVAYHQAVLDAMDKALIPGAQNAELKALLVKVRPAFVDHLEHAKHIQSMLSGQ
jgi:putative membrane protein